MGIIADCRLCQKDCAEECLVFEVNEEGEVINRGGLYKTAINPGESVSVSKKIWDLNGSFKLSEEKWENLVQRIKNEGCVDLEYSDSCAMPGLAIKLPGCNFGRQRETTAFQVVNSRIFNFCRQSSLINIYENADRTVNKAKSPDEAKIAMLSGLRVCEFQNLFYFDYRDQGFYKLEGQKPLAIEENEDFIKGLRKLATNEEGSELKRLSEELSSKSFHLGKITDRFYFFKPDLEKNNSIVVIVGYPECCHDRAIINKLNEHFRMLGHSFRNFLIRYNFSSHENLLQSRLERSLKEGRIATWSWNPVTGEFSDLGNFEMLLGFTFEELLQAYHDGFELIPEDDKKNVMRSLNDHLGGDVPYFSADFRMRHKSGHYVWFHAQGKIVDRDEKKRPIAMMGTVQDISEKVEMDLQLRQTQKMEAIGSLAGGIAHDFNNLLQVILGYAEMAKDKCFEATIDTDEVEQIIEAGDKAMMLVRQLLSFSRVQEQQLVNIALGQVLPEMVKLLRAFIGDEYELVTLCESQDLEIAGDSVQLEQLLMNLCVNARDAMPGGGKIEVRLNSENLENDIVTILGRIPAGEYVVLSVVDEGRGIDPAVQDRIFEPFFSTRDIGRGTGLGLAIVYSIVKRHNACMRLISDLGKGTSFFVYFPIHAGSERKPAAANASVTSDSAQTAEALAGNETILLAEDDSMVRRLAERTLTRAGYKVIPVESGLQACEKFFEDPDSVDLLLLDMVMPEMNGKEAFEKICEKSGKTVPVLFASGFSSDLLENEFMLKTPGKLLEKPYQKQQLLKMVRELLDTK